VINSLIDVDKIDYLVRDSVHCGVEYGKGIDVERLMDALYVGADHNRVCLNEKGRSAVLSILTCRNIMYQEVYWHKTVRACDSMFKRLFYHFVERTGQQGIAALFDCADDEFMLRIFNETKTKPQLQGLAAPFVSRGRQLYKQAYVYSTLGSASEMSDTQRFFSRVIKQDSYRRMVELSTELCSRLQRICPDIQPLDIIVDRAPVKTGGERYYIEGLQIWNTRRKRWENHPPEVLHLNEYLASTQQAYITCHPKYYQRLNRLNAEEWNGLLTGL